MIVKDVGQADCVVSAVTWRYADGSVALERV